MHATKLGAINQAQRIVGRFVRIDTAVGFGRALDDAQAVDELIQMGRQ
ncbi:MAG: hypothetical protein WD851_12325 [Pirellulales bacterium]